MDKPPYTISPKILTLVAEIQSLIGESKPFITKKPPLKLRKENKIKTVHHSLAIEGNTLSEDQVSSILEGKRVIGPRKEITEVKNALKLYDQIARLDPKKEKDFLNAHAILMSGLITKPGRYRQGAVGIFKNGKVSRMAPPAKQVPQLMKDLFSFLKRDKSTLPLIKACIFHYELEFIHPFEDGNGRMGRLWQQAILMNSYPLFEHLPIESLIHKNQKKYYAALEKSDIQGESTAFIEFSLEMIKLSLATFGEDLISGKPSPQDRIDAARVHFGRKEFRRKDYLKFHKGLSTATASRDLAEAVKDGQVKVSGTRALAKYRF